MIPEDNITGSILIEVVVLSSKRQNLLGHFTRLTNKAKSSKLASTVATIDRKSFIYYLPNL